MSNNRNQLNRLIQPQTDIHKPLFFSVVEDCLVSWKSFLNTIAQAPPL